MTPRNRFLAVVLALAATAAVAALGIPGAIAAPPKVLVCHGTGSATHPYVQFEVTERAAEAHLRHGDTRGTCPGGTPPEKVLICHKGGTSPSSWSSILVESSAVSGHLAHGDYLGACHVTPPDGTPRPRYGGGGAFSVRSAPSVAAPVTQLAATR